MSDTHLSDDRAWLEYRAQSIGRFAFDVLLEDQEASVAGVTSRGIFVRATDRWTVFVSFETYRSPLTITLAQIIDRLGGVKAGSPARVVSGRLILPSVGFAISASPDVVWRQPAPPNAARPVTEQIVTLRELAKGNGGRGLGLDRE